MKYRLPPYLSILRRATVVAAVCLLVWPCFAHSVFLFLALEDDGRLRIETGFSDGGTGAGMPLEIQDAATGAVLEQLTVPDSGVLHTTVPAAPYMVTLNAGEGHKVTKPGPMPEAAGAGAVKPMLVNCQWGDAAAMPEATREALRSAKVVIAHEWLFERLKALFETQTVVLVDAAVALSASGDSPGAQLAASYRDQIRQRLHAAVDAGESVAVLCPVAPESSPDWKWLLDEELAAAWSAPAPSL